MKRAASARRMKHSFILVPGPLVRGSSWTPTANALRRTGHDARIADLLDDGQPAPAWSDWPDRLAARLGPDPDAVLVGHSSAGSLVAALAARVTCRGLIIADGDVPSACGPAPPVRPTLHDFIRTLAAPDGSLPVWSRWFVDDPARAALVGIDRLARDPAALAALEAGLPRLSLAWFDDALALDGWDQVPAGYLQCSPLYDHAAAKARRRGWPVIVLDGAHLHPTLAPDETAQALCDLASRFDRAPSV